MQTALIILGCSGIMLAVLASVFRIEDARRGKMLFLGQFRVFLSTRLEALTYWFHGGLRFVRRRLYWFVRHYVTAVILSGGLKVLRYIEQKVEWWLRRQALRERRVTKDGKDKSHLDLISEHKASITLSEREKQRLRSHH